MQWKTYWAFHWFRWDFRRWNYEFLDEKGLLRARKGWQIGPIVKDQKMKYDGEV